jgi:Rrf2 family nitric oxide-sensitive transcriptional repressor
MAFSLQTDYGLRTLMYLAGSAERATVKEVANFFKISEDHVAKVVSMLTRLGYIRGIRGIGGGIELGKPTEQILLGEVVEKLEGNLHLLECVGRDGTCIIDSFCKLKRILAHAEKIQLDYLNSLTLRDILPTPKQMNLIEIHTRT